MVQEASLLNGISEIEEIQDSLHQSFNSFKNFELSYILPDDHHFFIYPQSVDRQFLCGSRRSKAGDQAIQLKHRMEKEWEVLRDNLPKSIFVRAYEGRKRQLMRVLIIGLKDTPSAYSLYFFDIFFPRIYPLRAPIIFNKRNKSLLKLSPNLLSFGNSNNGCLKFRWDPQTSDTYQLLKVIQGYALRCSKDDEKDFLVYHNTLLDILRSPPKGFEDYVKGYFRKSAHDILMNMRLNGNLGKSGTRTELFFAMVEAFEANGSYCKHLLHGVERRVSSFREYDINRDLISDGVFRRAFTKIKGFICRFCDDDH